MHANTNALQTVKLGLSENRTFFLAPLPRVMHWLIWLGSIVFLLGQNALLGLFAMISFGIITRMVWRTGEPQLPFYVCAFQWIQVASAIIQSDLAGSALANVYPGMTFEKATWLSLLAVTIFAIVFGAVIRIRAPQSKELIDATSSTILKLNLPNLFISWLALFLVYTLIMGAIRIPSLGTLINPIAYLRYGFAYLIFQNVLLKNKSWIFLLIVLISETIVGFLGFFGTFRLIYFVLILAAGSVLYHNKKLWLPLIASLSVLAIIGFFWQGVKQDYRSFVSGGERVQAIEVSTEEQLEYLENAIQDINSDTLIKGAENTLARLEYIGFFGLAIKQVPENIDYTGGRLWKEALMNVFMPRILFPNKMSFNDSDRTNEFCGVRVADASEGTSISIGFIGESYIDFGPIGMFIPIALMAFLAATFYSSLLKNAPITIVGYAYGTAFVFASILQVESSNAKIMGAMVSTFIVLRITQVITGKMIPEVMESYLNKETAASKPVS
jgi:hypothetical protein